MARTFLQAMCCARRSQAGVAPIAPTKRIRTNRRPQLRRRSDRIAGRNPARNEFVNLDRADVLISETGSRIPDLSKSRQPKPLRVARCASLEGESNGSSNPKAITGHEGKHRRA